MPILKNQEVYEKAVKLRERGKSIGEIAKLLNLSSSTVSLWVRHIALTPAQKQRLTNKIFETLQKGRIKAQKVQKLARQKMTTKLTKQAVKQLGKLSKRDIFITGIALYWGEGFKKDNRLGFASSDPAMIKLFLRWLALAGVPKTEIRLRVGLNISHRRRIGKVQKYWSEQTMIPLKQFQKPFFQKFKWKKEFANPESYYGVLRIRANNQGHLFTKIKAWLEQFRLAAIM